MTPQASKMCSLLSSDHHRLAFWRSNGINAEQVSGSFPILTILSLSPQASAQSEKNFLTLFLRPQEHVMGYVAAHEGAIHSSPGSVVHKLRMEARLG
jgi:hypothetical protein